MYNPENPCAIIGGEVVHEGETIGGYRVIKIHRDRVELEKNGKRITEPVQ
jgi:type II secretory pathway component PulC